MSGWVDKSATSAILNVAPGISAGVQLVGKQWVVNIIGAKSNVDVENISEAKQAAQNLLLYRLNEASSVLAEVMNPTVILEPVKS